MPGGCAAAGEMVGNQADTILALTEPSGDRWEERNASGISVMKEQSHEIGIAFFRALGILKLSGYLRSQIA